MGVYFWLKEAILEVEQCIHRRKMQYFYSDDVTEDCQNNDCNLELHAHSSYRFCFSHDHKTVIFDYVVN